MYLKLDFKEQTSVIDLDFGEITEVQSDANPYTGDYAVTPTVAGGTMPTKGKYMVQDVTIKPIPYYSASNTAGGTTVYIAKEI